MTAEYQQQLEAYKEAVIDTQSALYNAGTAYMNIVMVAGYAGAFAIWGFVKDYLTETRAMWAALLLGTSLFSFVFFTVLQMLSFTSERLRYASVSSQLSPAEYAAKIKSIEKNTSRSGVGWLGIVWSITTMISVVTGAAATCVLFCAFVENLLNGSA